MDQRQFATVMFAVLGVFIVASRLPDAFIIGAMAQQRSVVPDPAGAASPQFHLGVALAGTLFTVALGVGLVWFRGPLAHRLFPEATGPLEAREAQAVALSVLGCYFVVLGMQGLTWGGSLRWSAVLQLGLGLGLFLGARGVARLWAGVRGLGG